MNRKRLIPVVLYLAVAAPVLADSGALNQLKVSAGNGVLPAVSAASALPVTPRASGSVPALPDEMEQIREQRSAAAQVAHLEINGQVSLWGRFNALWAQAKAIYSFSYETPAILTAAAAISGKPMGDIGRLFKEAKQIYSFSYETPAILTAAAAISGKPMDDIGRLFEEAKQIYSFSYETPAILTAAAAISGKPMSDIGRLFKEAKQIYSFSYETPAILMGAVMALETSQSAKH